MNPFDDNMSLAIWREQVGRGMLQLDFAPRDGEPFRAQVQPLFASSDRRACRVDTSAGTTFRDRDLAKQGPPSYGLLIAQSGLKVAHRGRELALRPGDGVLLQNWEPGRLSNASALGYLALILPAEPVEQAGRALPPAGVLLRRDETALALLRGYLRLLETRASDDLSPELSLTISGHLFDLAMASVEGSDALADRTSSSAARTAMAIDYIERHHDDPRLSPATAAAALHISRRYLERLMEMSGKSFTARLTETRLAAAYRLLASPRGRDLRVSDIALQCGFSDVSHFTRRFRARYGAPPKAVRG